MLFVFLYGLFHQLQDISYILHIYFTVHFQINVLNPDNHNSNISVFICLSVGMWIPPFSIHVMYSCMFVVVV